MSEQLKHDIGQRVKAARLQRGLTQAALGEAIDKAFETISNIERGKTAPNFSTLSDIADALGVPMREFFGGDGQVLSGRRQELIFEMNAMVGQMDDRTLQLLLKLGKVLGEET
jgi:transcriptional regulator with XRE-family HTH domain